MPNVILEALGAGGRFSPPTFSAVVIWSSQTETACRYGQPILPRSPWRLNTLSEIRHDSGPWELAAALLPSSAGGRPRRNAST